MPRPIEVIINAGSGGVTEETAVSLREQFVAAGVAANVQLARSGREILQRAKNAVDVADTIVAGGGDGTVSAVAAEVAKAGKTLGVLPLGTLNNFSKDLAIPQTLPEAVETIAAGIVRS